MVNFLIAFREGLEAALVIGVMFGYLKRTNRMRFSGAVWAGIALALIVSLSIALLLHTIGAELEGTAEQLFEGITMLVAAIVVTGMVFWMRHAGRGLRTEIESNLGMAAMNASRFGLAGVAFMTVVREGIETALLLTAASWNEGAPQALMGTFLGLAAAAAFGWLIYTSAVKLNLRTFFTATSGLLLLFAAGLFGRSIHEFQEAGILPTLMETAYNLNGILDDASGPGSFFKTMFGYLSTPSLESSITYIGYLFVTFLVIRMWPVNTATPKTT